MAAGEGIRASTTRGAMRAVVVESGSGQSANCRGHRGATLCCFYRCAADRAVDGGGAQADFG